MRCSKKFCIEDAVDGSNYCQSHLKARGAPRPGVSNTRSASDGRFLDLARSNEHPAAKRASDEPANKASQNPSLLGERRTVGADGAPAGKKPAAKKAARKSSTG